MTDYPFNARRVDFVLMLPRCLRAVMQILVSTQHVSE